MLAPMVTPTRAPVVSRIRGIDAARALAIVGMVMVHFGPTGGRDGDVLGMLYGATHGRASILFVVLAGVGVALLAGDRSGPRRRSALAKLAYRAALLLPAGLALQELDTNVLVILQYYALYFLVAGAVMDLSERAVLGLGGTLVLLGPVAYVGLWMAAPDTFAAGGPAALSDPPARMATDLLLTGSYPLLTWAGPVVFGVWLGRRELRSPATRWRLIAGGAGLAGVALLCSALLTGMVDEPIVEPSWRMLVTAEPHSQMPLWLAQAMGVATAVLGACLLVADRLPGLSWPLVATGQMALTVYVGHLLVLAAWPELLQRDTVAGATRTVALFTLVTALICTAWRAFAARGPLEAVLRLPWGWRRTVRHRQGC